MTDASPPCAEASVSCVIAVDAMGGDGAPDVVVGGAVAAAAAGSTVILVGVQPQLESILQAHGSVKGISTVHASQVITMEDAPSTAFEKKRDSSLAVAARLVKEGRAQALVSAGSTGALMSGALLTLGRLPGIRRPAIAVPWPTERGTSLVLDAGANVDSKPEYLLQFATMGSVYAERVLGRKRPRVGLLNIGAEVGKGSALVHAAYALLEQSALNFMGNIEPTALVRGEVDVLVADGFVGNTMLKTGEAVAEFIRNSMRKNVRRSFRTMLGAWLMKPVFDELRRATDHSEYGGALLLGLRAPVVKAHGRSDARAIENAIKVASSAVRLSVTEGMALRIPGRGVHSTGGTEDAEIPHV